MTLAFSAILAGSLLHDRLTLCLLVLVGLGFALAWGMRPRAFTARILPALLLFGVAVPLPSLFLVAGASGNLLNLGPFSMSRAGLVSFTTLFLRVFLALAWAGSVFTTEEPHAVIESLALPSLMREILGMTLRYGVHIAREAWRMFLGRRARAPWSGFRDDATFIGNRAGLLFVRAHDLSQRVAAAMEARGYPGFARRQGRFHRPRFSDMAWLLAGACALAGVIVSGAWL